MRMIACPAISRYANGVSGNRSWVRIRIGIPISTGKTSSSQTPYQMPIDAPVTTECPS